MVTLQNGAVKFKSLKAAYAAAQKANPDLKWMTWYMRYRFGNSFQAAAKRPVRKYNKRVDNAVAA